MRTQTQSTIIDSNTHRSKAVEAPHPLSFKLFVIYFNSTSIILSFDHPYYCLQHYPHGFACIYSTLVKCFYFTIMAMSRTKAAMDIKFKSRKVSKARRQNLRFVITLHLAGLSAALLRDLSNFKPIKTYFTEKKSPQLRTVWHQQVKRDTP